MKNLLLVYLIMCNLAVLAQQTVPNVEANSMGVCSPNIISNQGPVTINCNTAMDKATTAKVVSLTAV